MVKNTAVKCDSAFRRHTLGCQIDHGDRQQSQEHAKKADRQLGIADAQVYGTFQRVLPCISVAAPAWPGS